MMWQECKKHVVYDRVLQLSHPPLRAAADDPHAADDDGDEAEKVMLMIELLRTQNRIQWKRVSG